MLVGPRRIGTRTRVLILILGLCGFRACYMGQNWPIMATMIYIA